MNGSPPTAAVTLYSALNLQVRRLLRGPDPVRHLEQLLNLAERLDAEASGSKRVRS